MARISRSVLSPYTLRLIENAAGMVLRRPIGVDGDDYWKDFSAKTSTESGSSINEYARRALVSSLTYVHSAILIDFPNDPHLLTLRDEIQSGRRPYFINIDAPQIWGWRQESTNPSSKLTQVRSRVVASRGRFRRKTRRTNPRHPSRHLRNLEYRGSHQHWSAFAGRNPARPDLQQPNGHAALCAIRVPLLDIASLNITHYQRQADLNQRAPHRCNAASSSSKAGTTNRKAHPVGVNYGRSTVPGDKVYYVGADSSCFQAQQDEIQQIESAQMSSLGVAKLSGQKIRRRIRRCEAHRPSASKARPLHSFRWNLKPHYNRLTRLCRPRI